CFFFFFQAEDGIRDRNVTGVQTCALPISVRSALGPLLVQPLVGRRQPPRELGALEPGVLVVRVDLRGGGDLLLGQRPAREAVPEIGRASCRERGEGSAGGARAERRA